VEDRPNVSAYPPSSQLTRPVSPVFGALSIESFDLTTSATEAAEMADWTFTYFVDSWLDPRFKPTWFAAFFNSPLVYHSLSFSVGILQDIVANRPVQLQRFSHRIKTIQIINKQLDHLDDVDLEPLLLAIVALWRCNTDVSDQGNPLPQIFSPHARSAGWVAVLGRLSGEGSHAQALGQLIRRKGGLVSFETLPGLQESLCLADIIGSSTIASKPRFESAYHVSNHLGALAPALEVMSDDVEGRGFSRNVPGCLPSGILKVLERIACVDKLLDGFTTRTAPPAEEYHLTQLTYAVQHELLSLPAWQILTLEEQEGSSFATYELCRITAMIYSTAVIFPISPSSPWLGKLLAQLKQMIVMASWSQSTMPLLVWTLWIGGLAAWQTPHRPFFTRNLQSVFARSALTRWLDVRNTLVDFLWRDITCGAGSIILWDALHVEDVPLGAEQDRVHARR
jgi:hypothetical protein